MDPVPVKEPWWILENKQFHLLGANDKPQQNNALIVWDKMAMLGLYSITEWSMKNVCDVGVCVVSAMSANGVAPTET